MTAIHCASIGEASLRLSDLLDAAEAGQTAALSLGRHRVAAIRADRWRHLLAQSVPCPQAVSEDGGWTLMVAGTPIAASGITLEAAIDELIDVLREYAMDWHARLHTAPNHHEHWGLAQFVDLSDDDQLAVWLRGSAPEQRTWR